MVFLIHTLDEKNDIAYVWAHEWIFLFIWVEKKNDAAHL
jgi:hypothetical protein